MSKFEYRVVPAPAKGVKVKGLKTPEARFAHVLEELMNELGAEGWEYQRTDTLPSIERAGLTGSTTQWRHVLVFRREIVKSFEVSDIPQDFPSPPVPAPLPETRAEPPLSRAGEEADITRLHGNDAPRTPRFPPMGYRRRNDTSSEG